MDMNLNQVIEQVVRDKGISREGLVETIEAAMLTAARKKLGAHRDLEAKFNADTGEVEIFEFKTIAEVVTDAEKEVTLDEAKQIDTEAQIGDSLGFKLNSSAFGRIAAQTAKQVIIQRVREAEREMVYNEYKDRKGEIITGIARRFERGNVIVDLGRTEAVLPVREQCPRESYRAGDRVVAYVKEIDREARGPQIILSRSDVGLLLKLFEAEVPEIFEGIVRIVCAARDPGARSKIAVASRAADVDPIGACVGMKGSRVQAVVQELRGEKIDIVPYNEDSARFVCAAIAPAEVTRVIIDEENHTMELIVPDDQLSLAIGRKGQNVRLAAQLTGWKIEIHSETQAQQMVDRAYKLLMLVDGVKRQMAEQLYKLGYQTVADIADADVGQLNLITGAGMEAARRMKSRAAEIMATGGPTLEGEPAPQTAEELVAAEESLPPPEPEPGDLPPAPEDVQKMPLEDQKLLGLPGMGMRSMEALHAAGYRSLEQIDQEADIAKLAESTKLGLRRARQIKDAARLVLAGGPAPAEPGASPAGTGGV